MKYVWVVEAAINGQLVIVGIYDIDRKAKSRAAEYYESFVTRWTVE